MALEEGDLQGVGASGTRLMVLDFLRSLLENAGAILGYGKGTTWTNEPISDAKSVCPCSPSA